MTQQDEGEGMREAERQKRLEQSIEAEKRRLTTEINARRSQIEGLDLALQILWASSKGKL